MNEITRFLGGGRTPAQSAGVTRRLKMRALRREIASADGLEREALTGELALLQGEAHAQTSERLAAHYVATKSPRAQVARQEANKAKSTLATIKARLGSLLGFSSTPAPAPTPPSTPPTAAKADWRTINAGSSPEAVEAAMLDLCAYPSKALGPDWVKDPNALGKVMGRVDVIVRFLDAVGKIDPSGKVIERVDNGTPAERKEAARIVGGILQRIATEL